MASKAHVDSTVNERRLRPIYDWLDNGNNKKALQEADKVLRKQPGNQCARVLKALAMLRLGKEDECQVIMEKVQAEIPCEDSTLQAMSICYREIHQPDKISEVYEAAAKADPNNEELLTHLFMSYVRLEDFKKQQQTAMALYKLKPKNPYYFWAVMSLVMQAMRAEDKLAKGVILPLAERMVLKLVNEGKIEAEQEVQLYLMVLELQGKGEEVLQILSGPLAPRLSALPQRKASLLLQLEKFPAAADAFKELIEQDGDNWAYYRDYLTAALKFQTPQQCLEFLDETVEAKGKKARAPQLARFELLKRLREMGAELEALQPIEPMRRYFAQFGEKGCVVGDLRLFLHLLTSAERLQLLVKIEQDVGVEANGSPRTVGQMQKHIHLEQLRRICGFHHLPSADVEERKRLVDRLCGLFEEGNTLCPPDERLPTDFSPADSYALMATHLLHQLWVETNDASHLYRAMELLERSLVSSPANFHIKILLVRAYLEAGLVGAANHVFTLLDAKHIQLDSMGHLHAPLLAPLGHLSQASTTLDHAAKFFVANYKDSADHLTFAYKFGSFVKIQEFVELRERLEHSFHFAMTTVDKMLLELSWCDSPGSLLTTLSSMRVQPQEDSIRWDLLKDNRDLEVVVGWEPLQANQRDDRMREETRTCMLRLLASRNLMLRLIAAASEPEGSALLARLSSELSRLDREDVPAALRSLEHGAYPRNILVPLDAAERLREAHKSEQLSVVARLALCLSSSAKLDAETLRALESSPCLRTHAAPPQDCPASYKDVLLRASTCGETLAILGAICCACAIQAQPLISSKRNKKRGGKEIVAPPSEQSSGNWLELVTVLADRVRDLDAALSALEKLQLQTGLNTEISTVATVVERGQASIVQSCRELKSRAQITLKLVNSLKS